MTISADMEDLQNFLFMDIVPDPWVKLAYPSNYGLSAWFADLLNRATELANWSSDFNVYSSTQYHQIKRKMYIQLHLSKSLTFFPRSFPRLFGSADFSIRNRS